MNYNSYEYELKLLQNTKPIMAYDYKEDFSVWQKRAEAKLSKLLGMDSFERSEDLFEIVSESDHDTYKRIDFRFQSEKECFVPCTVLIPKNVIFPAPTVINVQGHTTGMHISLGETKFEKDKDSVAYSDFGLRAVKEGCVAFCIEQRFMGVRGRNPKNGAPDCLDNSFHVMLPLLLGRTAIGERVWDISRLIDVAIKYFGDYVDTDRIVCLGNSGGGTATFYASCLEKRIAVSVPSCAVCTYDASILAMFHCTCNYVPGIRKYFNMGDLCGLILPRRLVIVSGDKDAIFPIEGATESYDIAKAMYAHAASAEDCVHVIGDGPHRSYPDDWWQVLHSFLDK
ncbi:MAG: hypothetical protein IJ391_08405 [Clostridia bacterium]|nr:hypothetical protein [Clostridia bacterium]